MENKSEKKIWDKKVSNNKFIFISENDPIFLKNTR